MKTIGISITFIVAVFVFISCTPKDRTPRINEIYEEYVKESPDETKDESKTPDEKIEPDDEQVEEDVEIIDEFDEDPVDDSDIFKVSGAICTGQTKCYNDTEEITCPNVGEDFYGQDAQYLDKCVPRSYTISGIDPEEIVTDNNTGLQWQRTLSENTFTWQEAIDYCEGLNYDGQDDWRLPTFYELVFMPNYGMASPSFEKDIFNKLSSLYYWSSSDDSKDNTNAWSVHFVYGAFKVKEKTVKQSVICVGGDDNFKVSFEADALNGVIIDNSTNLEYFHFGSIKKNWTEALNFCNIMEFKGFRDWRLPNINEVKMLIPIFENSLNGESSIILPEEYWSSTSHHSTGSSSWGFDFYSGDAIAVNKTSDMHFFCVRNGE